MLVNPQPIAFDGARAVNQWLDRWAAEHLDSPEGWSQALGASRDWSDYSPRNQLLLASYGATGPVAGIETWHLVPNRDGGTCAIRSGEHALPVRVPVTTGSAEPDPHLGGVRPTQAAVAGWEWRGVFCVSQLARRPEPAVLTRTAPKLTDEQARTAAGAAARRTLRGRLPDGANPLGILEAAAAQMPRSSTRPPLADALAAQVAQLAMTRVGRDGPMPEFNPGSLRPRQRWESLLDVVDTERRLSAAMGRKLGIDLLASPLPRMTFEDDRVVPAHRRNRLPRASVAKLPIGQWVDVGPYSAEEWAVRGESGSGKGSYFRLTSTAYVVAIEQGDQASWRLEDTRTRVGAGRLDGAEASDLAQAKASALATIARRYPQVTSTPTPEADPPPGWVAVEGQPGAWTQSLHGRATSWVLQADDQWIAMVSRDSNSIAEIAGTPTATRSEAMEAATAAARRALREQVLETRVDFDHELAEFAEAPHYSRQGLMDRLSTRLAETEQARLARNARPTELVELLGAAGATAETTVAVLHAELVPAEHVGPLLPLLGISPSDGIGELHRRWGISRVEAAELVDATAAEMRAAGCGPREILATRPRDALPTLTAHPDLWDLAGGTLARQHTVQDAAGFLSMHAPNADCFAAGLVAAVDDPVLGLGLAARRGMPTHALAACSERYGLSPIDTAGALRDGNVDPRLAVSVVLARCDGDPVLTTQIARSELGMRTDVVVSAITDELTTDEAASVHQRVRSLPSLSNDRRALLEAHRTPQSSDKRVETAMKEQPSTEHALASPPGLDVDRQELL